MLSPTALGRRYGKPVAHTLKLRVLVDSASVPNVSPPPVISAQKSLWQVLEVWSAERLDEYSVVAPSVETLREDFSASRRRKGQSSSQNLKNLSLKLRISR